MSGIPSWAVKGAKVECIHVRKVNSTYRGGVVAVGVVYAIRETHVAPWGDAMVALDGVHNITGAPGPYWPVEDFRPLVTRTQEQDISEHFSGFLRGEFERTA